MKFMISFYHQDGVWDGLSTEQQEIHGGWLKDFAEALRSKKNSQMVFFNPVTTKHVRQEDDGVKSLKDGPVNKGAEALGGYYIIEAENWDEAQDWAERGRFMTGSNEIKEIVDFSL